jgi:hypothetical protein
MPGSLTLVDMFRQKELQASDRGRQGYSHYMCAPQAITKHCRTAGRDADVPKVKWARLSPLSVIITFRRNLRIDKEMCNHETMRRPVT